MRFLILSLTIISCWAVEAEPVKLLPDVQTAIDRATAAETATQNEADAKILKVKQALIKDLTKLQETYTKKGNLDAANGIKAKIGEVNKSMPDLLGDKARVSTSKFVTLYPLPDYKGMPAVIRDVDTVINFDKIPFPNDGLRSVRVPVGYVLTAFADDLGNGEAVNITEDTPVITGVALGMTSIIVKKKQ